MPAPDDVQDLMKQSSEVGLTKKQKQNLLHSAERWNQSIMSNVVQSSQAEVITSKLP